MKSDPPQRNTNQYEHYEEDLNNYLNKSKSEVQEWKMMESKLLSNLTKQYGTNPNKSPTLSLNKTPKIASSSIGKGSKVLMMESVTLNTKDSLNYQKFRKKKNTYCFKVYHTFDSKDMTELRIEEIKQQIKEMREMFIKLNKQTNEKLSKYELAQIQWKSHQVYGTEVQILSIEVQANKRIINGQNKQIQGISRKDKELQQTDFLIQLQEKANIVLKQIHGKKKQKYGQKVIVEKLDSKLIQRHEKQEALQSEQQQRVIKILKHLVLYYFKKSNKNQEMLDHLEHDYAELVQKEKKLLEKYNELCKKASQNNMIVQANKEYMRMKKVQDQLRKGVAKAKKNEDITKFSYETKINKIEKEISKMKMELSTLEENTQKAQEMSQKYGKKADSLIQKHGLGDTMTKDLSYRFAQNLIKGNQHKNTQENEILQQEKQSKYFLKPKTNNKHNKKTIENSSRYKTIDQKQSHKHSVNDKNFESLGATPEKLPNLKQKNMIKSKRNDAQSPEVTDSHNLPRFNRLKLAKKTQKKQIPTGPLSDEYMRKLEEKGMKNLSGL